MISYLSENNSNLKQDLWLLRLDDWTDGKRGMGRADRKEDSTRELCLCDEVWLHQWPDEWKRETRKREYVWKSEGEICTCYSAGLQDGGMGPQAKKCRQDLEAGKGKVTDSPLKSLAAPQPCRPIDFYPSEISDLQNK